MAAASGRERFGKAVITKAKAHKDVEFARYGPGFAITYGIRTDDGHTGEGVIDLASLMDRFDGAIDPELDHVVDAMIELFVASCGTEDGSSAEPVGGGCFGEWESDAPQLRPVLRWEGKQHAIGGLARLVSRPCLPYLVEMLVLDRPTTREVVGEHHLEQWGVTAEQAFEVAARNLAFGAAYILESFTPEMRGQGLGLTDDTFNLYICSMPLVPGWLSDMEARTGHRPIVFILGEFGNADKLTIAIDPELDGLALVIKQLNEQYVDEVKPVSTVPYTIDDDGNLIEYQVDESQVDPRHPARIAINSARKLLAARIHEEQAARLDPRHTFGPYVCANWAGVTVTVTSWQNGVRTLLPNTDFVCVLDPATDVMFEVLSAKAVEYLAFEPVPDMDPPRYQVESISAAEMAELRMWASGDELAAMMWPQRRRDESGGSVGFGIRVLHVLDAHTLVESASPALGFAVTVQFAAGPRRGEDVVVELARLHDDFGYATDPELQQAVDEIIEHAAAELDWQQTISELERAAADLTHTAVEVADFEPVADWARAASQLRPVLRWTVVEHVTGADVVSRPCLPFLVETLILDSPSKELVGGHHLARWGVSAELAFQVAARNLAEAAARAVKRFEPGRRGVRVELTADACDAYPASLPLVEGWLGEVWARAGYRPIVFLPGESDDGEKLIVRIDPHPEALAELIPYLTERYSAAPKPLSPLPYTVDDDGALIEYTVEPEHPAFLALAHARELLATDVYRRQTTQLLAEYPDDTPAALLGMEFDTGVPALTTSLILGRSTLLPQAEFVCVADVDSDVMYDLPWAHAAECLSLRPLPGLDPPRFRVGAVGPQTRVLLWERSSSDEFAARLWKPDRAGSAGRWGFGKTVRDWLRARREVESVSYDTGFRIVCRFRTDDRTGAARLDLGDLYDRFDGATGPATEYHVANLIDEWVAGLVPDE